jgi:hypothetical protein
MNPLIDYRQRLLERLETVPSDIADAIAAIPERDWHTPASDTLRSPHANLSLLRDMERHAFLARLQRLLAEDQPFFDLFYFPHWDEASYNPAEPMTQILADYSGLREAEMQILRSLTLQQWAREGRHTTLGLRTVQWWAERMLEYSEDRLKELRQ